MCPAAAREQARPMTRYLLHHRHTQDECGVSEVGRRRPMMGSVKSDGCDLYYEEAGQGIPVLLIHPAGATASTWGSATEELGRIGRVLTYDRRGYARSGGGPGRSGATHAAG